MAAPRARPTRRRQRARSPAGLWNWNWTFTFCDETTAVSTLIDSQTPLSWTWNWTWNWTCEGAAGAPARARRGHAPPRTDATPVPPLVAGDTSASRLRRRRRLVPVFTVDVPLTPKFPPLLGTRSCRRSTSSASSTWTSRSSRSHWLLALPELLLPVARRPRRRRVGGHRSRRDARNACTEERPSSSRRRATCRDTAETESSDASADDDADRLAAFRRLSERTELDSRPAKPASAHPAPPRQAHGPQLPFGQPRSSETAGSGTSGGRVPSVPVAAVAALIAFFMLAAPRLGRRIRVARELSPRSTYRSSIDHPG